jgi:hypothetical protein
VPVLDRCKIPSMPVYGPIMTVITAITNSSPAQITTNTNHGYVSGTIVRFDIPPACGMQQIDQMFAPILVTGPTTFTAAIDTTFFSVFAIPEDADVHTNVCSLCVPIGEINETLLAAEKNIL